MSEHTAIVVRNLEVRYRKNVVLDIPELTLAAGEIHSLVGGNGAGKSTLLRTVAGLLEPTAGTVAVLGMNPYDPTYANRLAALRRMTLCLQQATLFRSSVRDNIAYGLRFRNVANGERTARVEEAAAILGVEHLLSRTARTLSGGESQRVALARAFALRPEVLLLDEPVASVDQEFKARILEAVRALASAGTTVVIATHWTTHIRSLAARIVRLEKGRLGPPALENLFAGEVVETAAGTVAQLAPGVCLPVVTERRGPVRIALDPAALGLLSGPESAHGLPVRESAHGLPVRESARGLPVRESARGLPVRESAHGLPVRESAHGLPGRVISLTAADSQVHVTVDVGVHLRIHLPAASAPSLTLGTAVTVAIPRIAIALH